MVSLNDKIKVMMLLPDFPENISQIRGGVHAAVLNLLAGFRNMPDIEIHLMTFTKNKNISNKEVLQENTFLYRLYEGPFPFHTMNHASICMIKLRKWVKQIKPDLIHYQVGNGFMLTSMFANMNIPIIQTVHGMPSLELKQKKQFLDKVKWLIHSKLNQRLMAKHIIHLSEFSRKKFDGFAFQSTLIIPNAIKNDYFDLSISPEFQRKLLFIGQFDSNKNLLFLLNIFRQMLGKHKAYSLHVAGGMTDKFYYKKIQEHIYALELHEKVIFHGWCDEQKKLDLLSRSDILVIPSKHESLPMVVMEAMASGLIVIANRTGGIPEMITDGKNGFLFDVNNPDTFHDAISKLENNLQNIYPMKIQARQDAYNTYHTSIIARKTKVYYHKVIQEKC